MENGQKPPSVRITARDMERAMACGRWSIVSVLHTPDCERTENAATQYFATEHEALTNLSEIGGYDPQTTPREWKHARERHKTTEATLDLAAIRSRADRMERDHECPHDAKRAGWCQREPCGTMQTVTQLRGMAFEIERLRAYETFVNREGQQYPDPDGFCSAMVKVGALAFAALEAVQRHQAQKEAEQNAANGA